jgi:hypothetical protein
LGATRQDGPLGRLRQPARCSDRNCAARAIL